MMGWARRVLPTSLFRRALLILFLPTIIVQLVATYMFYKRHWDEVARHMAHSLAGDVAFVVQEYVAAEGPEAQNRVIRQADHFLRMQLAVIPPEPPKASRRFSELKSFRLQLADKLPAPFYVTRDDETITTLIYLPEATLRLVVSKKRLVSPTTYIFIMWMVGTAVLMLVVAIVFLRNQVRPISQLAEAAEAFGKGRDIAQFRPRGATEVRRAGAAFLNMKERITRQITTRTEMLAAISHDLRTPLTRMKLELAMLPEAEAQALQGDVQEMEYMIEEYLRFASGEGPEQAKPVRLDQLLTDIVNNYRRQEKTVQLFSDEPVTLPLREHAIRRCLHNVLDNAFRYARNVQLSVEVGPQQVEIRVDDDGPGIPPAHRQRMLQPFTRLDASRNLNRGGGVGLGLAIAQDIVLGHGGKLWLEDSPLGGLQVRIRIPF